MIETPPPDAPEPIEQVATRIGGRPGSSKWEIVTAIFGWSAAFALLGWIVAHIFGFGDIAGYLFAGFSSLIGIALKRDFIKLLMTGRSGW